MTVSPSAIARPPGPTRFPAWFAGPVADPALLLQLQLAALRALVVWQEGFAAACRDATDQWACRAGALRIDG